MEATFASSCSEPPPTAAAACSVSGVTARSCSEVKRYCGACVVIAVLHAVFRIDPEGRRGLEAAGQRNQHIIGHLLLRQSDLVPHWCDRR